MACKSQKQRKCVTVLPTVETRQEGTKKKKTDGEVGLKGHAIVWEARQGANHMFTCQTTVMPPGRQGEGWGKGAGKVNVG